MNNTALVPKHEKLSSIRLLLVDDESVLLQSFATLFKKKGLSAMTANCGRRCLQVVETHPVDVVVLDIKMPDMDGHEVHQRIRKRYPDTEVIFLTGHGSTPDGVAGIKAGAFDYLTKPVAFDHLYTKIVQAHEKKIRSEERAREASHRAAMEKQLMAAERLASLGVLASGVAHEINNPLAIVQGWSELMRALLDDLEDGFPLREEFERGLEKIDLAVNRAKQITAKMLGTIQKRQEAPLQINPSDILGKTLAIVMKSAESRHVSIVRGSEKKTITFQADPYPVQQVLMNVLDNAVEAAPQGGTVTCRTDVLEDRYVVFYIEDNGDGISPGVVDKIFDPFFTTKSDGQAAGLGLFVSRKIVEKMGGDMGVRTRPGHGTTVWVRFPLRSPASETGP